MEGILAKLALRTASNDKASLNEPSGCFFFFLDAKGNYLRRTFLANGLTCLLHLGLLLVNHHLDRLFGTTIGKLQIIPWDRTTPLDNLKQDTELSSNFQHTHHHIFQGL